VENLIIFVSYNFVRLHIILSVKDYTTSFLLRHHKCSFNCQLMLN